MGHINGFITTHDSSSTHKIKKVYFLGLTNNLNLVSLQTSFLFFNQGYGVPMP